MESYHIFTLGSIAMGFAAAGLFFLRFWRQTKDRLFLIFAFAFWFFAIGRVLIVAVGNAEEPRTWIYTLRLFGFLLIILAIVDKNLGRGKSSPTDPSRVQG